jgi:hypothetical protein
LKAVEETPTLGENAMRSLAKIFASLIAAIVAVASLASAVQAQNLSFGAKVDVPFAFETTTGQRFQPGVYNITITGSQVMVIRGENTSGLAMIQSKDIVGVDNAKGKAIFTHYGDKYYLRSVSVAGSPIRLVFGSSKNEKRSQLAGNQNPSSVEVALLNATH